MTIGVFLLGLLIGTIVGIVLVSILQMGRFEDDDEEFSTDSDFPDSELEESK